MHYEWLESYSLSIMYVIHFFCVADKSQSIKPGLMLLLQVAQQCILFAYKPEGTSKTTAVRFTVFLVGRQEYFQNCVNSDVCFFHRFFCTGKCFSINRCSHIRRNQIN